MLHYLSCPRSCFHLLALVVVFANLTVDAGAQAEIPRTAPPVAGASVRPAMTAAWTTAAPIIDGRLDEAIWRTAAPVGDFVQRSPRGGAPGSQRSEVRVAYDGNAIYVGVRNFDTAPDSIALQLGRRDADEIYSDWFSVGFDSYGA